MKGNVFKRIVCLVLAFIMVVSVCACGNSKNAEANNAAAKEAVYSYKDIDLGIDLSNVSIYGINYANDRLYVLIEDYSGQFAPAAGARLAVETPVVGVLPEVESEYVYQGPTYVLISANVDGTDVKNVTLEMETDNQHNSYMNRVILGSEGDVIGVQETYIEDYSDPDNPIFKSVNYLIRWDKDGKLLWKKDMAEYVGEVEWYYPRDMFTLEDNSILFFSYEGIGAHVDQDGQMIAPIEMDAEMANRMGNVFRKSDGTTYMTSYNDDYTKMYISEFDVMTGKEGEKTLLPGTLTNYTFYSGFNADFTLTNNKGVFTYNIGDEEPVQIMDFINSDFPATYVNNVLIMDDTHMLGYYYDQIDYKTHLALFTKVNPEDVPDKKTILLGCYYLDYSIRKRIIDFNKTNSEYRITVKDYSSYASVDDYNAGYTQLNNDIITGQMPDILVVNSEMDINNYISKGVLTDIGNLIAEDEELSQVELMPNVVEAFSVDGKLYTLVPSFSIQSMIGKTSILGDREGWTMAEFMEFANSLPEGSSVFQPEMLRDSFIYQVMRFLGSDFVDPMTGKCSFDSQEFINILEFAATLPEELPEDFYEDYDWSEYDTMYRNDRVVLMEVYMSRISDLKYQIKGQIGEDVTFIGFPTAEGNGSVIQLGSNAFAISAKSAFTDGAWEFVRYYLTDEYQSSNEYYDFPVVKSVFLEKAAEATQKPYWIDENGNKVEYDDTYYIGGEEIKLDPFTQEEIDEICEFIYTVNKTSRFDDDIRTIITEEAQSFFEGQKSAQEVAKIIQSRAQVYIDENR